MGTPSRTAASIVDVRRAGPEDADAEVVVPVAVRDGFPVGYVSAVRRVDLCRRLGPPCAGR